MYTWHTYNWSAPATLTLWTRKPARVGYGCDNTLIRAWIGRHGRTTWTVLTHIYHWVVECIHARTLLTVPGSVTSGVFYYLGTCMSSRHSLSLYNMCCMLLISLCIWYIVDACKTSFDVCYTSIHMCSYFFCVWYVFNLIFYTWHITWCTVLYINSRWWHIIVACDVSIVIYQLMNYDIWSLDVPIKFPLDTERFHPEHCIFRTLLEFSSACMYSQTIWTRTGNLKLEKVWKPTTTPSPSSGGRLCLFIKQY